MPSALQSSQKQYWQKTPLKPQQSLSPFSFLSKLHSSFDVSSSQYPSPIQYSGTLHTGFEHSRGKKSNGELKWLFYEVKIFQTLFYARFRQDYLIID